MRLITTIILVCFIGLHSSAQPIQELNANGEISLRGLSVVNDKVVWVSGSKGTVGKSVDGGKTWKWMKVKGFKKCDFRDIEAFDEYTAIIMAVASPAYILKTVDGGKKWKKVYENKGKEMFLDAMDFKDDKLGYVIGDPIQNKFFIGKTIDGGDTWKELVLAGGVADSGEACFASSGSNIRALKNGFVFVSGGLVSNFVLNRKGLDVNHAGNANGNDLVNDVKLPLIQGLTSSGANSIAIKDSLNFIVVGGDFTKDGAIPNCAITNDGGETWILPNVPPTGYKSCVEYLYGNVWVCCGLTGIDVSQDNGLTWRQISNESYHACRKAKTGNAVFFSGTKSHIGRFASR